MTTLGLTLAVEDPHLIAKPSPFLKPAVDAVMSPAVKEVLQQTVAEACEKTQMAAHQFVADLIALSEPASAEVVAWGSWPGAFAAGPFSIGVRVTLRCLTHGFVFQHHEVITAGSDGHSRAEQVVAAFAQICQQTHSSAGYASGGYIESRTPAVVLGDVIPALNQQYPFEYWTLNAGKCGPICWPSGTPMTLANMIVHLNDRHNFTRERIADWLETLDLDLTLQPASQGD